ncbi:MAG TPA: carboxypeptidase regulatory-like domain-containing protein [Bryobacteraceae bacterium]|nr:carboxypeptidase regulatory-like domain-containing protein [Bryobacteraceae bacterium]
MRKTLGLLLCLLAASTLLCAQSVAGLGAISGSVRDATGAGVPGAEVVVTDQSKGIRRTLTSNEAGVFTANSLVPSSGYSVIVKKTGFADFQLSKVEVLVGQNVQFTVLLQVAGTSTVMNVDAVAPLVDSTRTDVSQVVNSNQIVNMPINGRRVDSFVLLAPAVVPDGTYGLVSFRGTAGGNTFLTDGNDTTQQYYNENAGRTRITTQISQDAVQEFQVVSNNYSAEFGRATGGVVNTVTRSGSNDLHGTGYWFFRNQDFNARDPFAATNPPETRHQAGGSLGGKLITDKLFYFANFEATRRDFPLVASLTRPPLFDSTGKFVETQPDGKPTCGSPATPAQCEAAVKFLDRQFQVLQRTANSELGFAKLDWRPNDRNSFSASMNYLRWLSPNGIQTQAVLNNGNGVGNNASSSVRTRYGRFSWTAVPNATIVNEFRFGWFKDKLYDYPSSDLEIPGIGSIGLTVQSQANLGTARDYPRLNPSENRFQFADNLTWTKGKHTLKFGADIMSTEDYVDSLYGRVGLYNYGTFTNFALDFSGNTAGGKRWQSYGQAFGTTVASTTVKDYGFFAQDQWRVTPSITVNLGLRYDYASLPQPTVTNPDYPATGYINSPGKNFAPRVGLAYSFNNNRTVLRAGYGLFYARFHTSMINTLFVNNGVYQRSLSLQGTTPSDLALGPVWPNQLAGLDRTPPAGTVDVNFASENLKNPYTQQGDIAIEHEITRNLGITASYIWSRGLQLFGVSDLNIGAQGPAVTYRINDASRNQIGTYTTATYLLANRVDKRWRRLNVLENGGNSYYNGLAVQLRKRMSGGMEYSASYTWSHAIDYGLGTGSDNTFMSSPTRLFNGDTHGEKQTSALDQRHRLTVTHLWAPTFTKRDGLLAKYLINNWQLSQLWIAASSFASTATISVTGAPFTGAAFNSTLNGYGSGFPGTRVPFWPARNLDIGSMWRADARVSKILPFGDRYKLFVNFEAFNVFNNPSFTSVNGLAYAASGGVLTPQVGLGEGSATQGFPDGTNARRAQVSMRFIW